jgi:hypothetical protein
VGVDAVRTGIGAGRLIPLVYGICPGYSLCIGLINRFSVYEPLIIKTLQAHGAHLSTIPASGAFVHIDISGALVQRHLKIAGFTAYLFNLRYGVKLYIDVPADLDQFR